MVSFYSSGISTAIIAPQAKGMKKCLPMPSLPFPPTLPKPIGSHIARLWAICLIRRRLAYEGDCPAQGGWLTSPGLNKKPQAIIHIKPNVPSNYPHLLFRGYSYIFLIALYVTEVGKRQHRMEAILVAEGRKFTGNSARPRRPFISAASLPLQPAAASSQVRFFHFFLL